MRMPLFRGAKRWLIIVTGMLLSSILLAACGENSPSILDTAGPVAASESGVFYAILIIATIVFIGVEGVLIFSIFRFRERPGAPRPRQLHGNTKIEVLWTVIPALILFIVLGYTIRGLFDVATPSGDLANKPTIQVTAFAHQWWWEFYYPEYNVTTADSLVVPVNTVVNVHLYSNNVIHSFWVPQLTGKTDVVPGHDNTRWFIAEVPNKTYLGICAEYCGTQHGNMRFNVVTDDNNNFLSWVHTQQQAAVTPASGSLAAQGEQVFKSTCESCHGIVGVDLKQAANPDPTCDPASAGAAQGCFIGPNLTHFGSRDFIAGGVLENNADQCQDPNNLQNCNLAKWLHDPQAVKPGNDMSIGPLTNDQIKQLVAYLEGLK